MLRLQLVSISLLLPLIFATPQVSRQPSSYQAASQARNALNDSVVYRVPGMERIKPVQETYETVANQPLAIHLYQAVELKQGERRPVSAGKSLHLAIVYVADGTQSQFFPATLADDTLKPRLLAGNTPPDLKFDFNQWAQVTFLREQKSN